MAFSTRHLADALSRVDRPAPPAPISGRRSTVYRSAYPYRAPAPLPWLYRSDPFVRLAVISIPLLIAIVVGALL